MRQEHPPDINVSLQFTTPEKDLPYYLQLTDKTPRKHVSPLKEAEVSSKRKFYYIFLMSIFLYKYLL